MSIPTILSDIVRIIIIMSISGGAVALLLLLIKPLVRHRLPKTAQYYFWLVVLFALLVPVSQIFTLPQQAPGTISTVVERNFVSVTEEPARLVFHPGYDGVPRDSLVPGTTITPGNQGTMTLERPTGGTFETAVVESTAVTQLPPSPTALAFTMFMLLYPLGVLLVLGYNLIGYFYFTTKLRRNAFAPYEEEITMLNHLTNGRRTPRLLCSKLAATPMLIGFFKPVIILPDREYTGTQLHGILLHELTHMRRHDIAIKWVTLLACAVHWFSPLAWLAKREINRTCELSCDEAVILNMDTFAKQNYGNTLINVATDTKIPMPVLSTTMCQEKRALKERLRAIMKSKKHTKLAFVVSMFIMLLAALGACTLGASRNSDDTNEDNGYYENGGNENNAEITHPSSPTAHQPITGGVELPTPTSTPTTRQDFADIHIFDAAVSIGGISGSPHLRITDSRINSFEHVLDFTHVSLDRTIELWRLDFALRAEYEAFFSWGTYTPDENGWISNDSAFNVGVTFLMFSQDGSQLTFEGSVPWSWLQFTDYVPALEELLRQHLQWMGIIPLVDFPGDLAFVYAWLDHGDGLSGHFIRMLLSRPVRQGEGGVWMVERVEHLHDTPGFPVATNMDDRAGIIERLAYIQNLIDTGQIQDMVESGLIEDPWHFTDPQGAAIRYLQSRPWQQNFVITHIHVLPEGTINPFELPRLDGPEIVIRTPEELSRMQTETPRVFSASWQIENCEFVALRERTLARIDTLAFNEAYHFRTDDGRYALVTGWRPLISREEFQETTGMDVPQQIGDFRLVGITVNDNIFDSIFVYNNPIPPEIVHQFFAIGGRIDQPVYGGGPLPINEVFTRNVVVRNFYAMYVNSNGDYVSMGVTDSLGHHYPMYVEHLLSFTPFNVVNVNNTEIALVGGTNRYAFAFYASTAIPGMGIELGFANPNTIPIHYSGWAMTRNFGGAIPASGEALAELVEIFNPSALFAEYGWRS